MALDEFQLKLASVRDLTIHELTTAFKTVAHFDPDLAQKWKELIGTFEENLAATAEAITNRDPAKLPQPLEPSITDFNACLAKLDPDRAELIDSNLDQETA